MLTLENKATNFETMLHIERVRNLLNICVIELLKRGEEHDQSKLDSPEVDALTKATSRLHSLTYGSKEYEENKNDPELKHALEHHYANNRHHPQFYKNGVDDMNLIDIIEMFIDWTASSERHHNGNPRKSIEINKEKFNISNQLAKIMENTLDLIGK